MIVSVPNKIASVGGLGDKKTEQVKLRMSARFQVRRIEFKMTEAANIKWLVKRATSDVVVLGSRCGHAASPRLRCTDYNKFAPPMIARQFAIGRRHGLLR